MGAVGARSWGWPGEGLPLCCQRCPTCPFFARTTLTGAAGQCEGSRECIQTPAQLSAPFPLFPSAPRTAQIGEKDSELP